MPNLSRAHVRNLQPWASFADDQLDIVIDMVEGWLLDATRLDELPDPLPQWLWAAAVELSAILAENPSGLAQRTAGPTMLTWPMQARRDAIVTRVERRYRSERTGPRGSFPAPMIQPEPEAGSSMIPFGSGYLVVTPGSVAWVGAG